MRDENKDLKPTDREDPDKEYAKHEINGVPNPNPFDKLLPVIVKSKHNRQEKTCARFCALKLRIPYQRGSYFIDVVWGGIEQPKLSYRTFAKASVHKACS